MKTIYLLITTLKGLSALKLAISTFGGVFSFVVVSQKDKHMKKDFYDEIQDFCDTKKIKFMNRLEFDVNANRNHIKICIGWKHLLDPYENTIVIHDSILPMYKGFNPLVSMLINGEKKVGITSFLANKDADDGKIINQRTVDISYPITISEAIDEIIPLYENEVSNILHMLETSGLEFSSSLIENESYSLWRDEEDYKINWSWSSQKIKRFIDATGFPYTNAKALMNRTKVKIVSSEVYNHKIVFENPTIGKVFRIIDGCPVVLCGNNELIKLTKIVDKNGLDIIPLKKLKTRFE
jgi:methionyl-tRNA formyltransferase